MSKQEIIQSLKDCFTEKRILQDDDVFISSAYHVFDVESTEAKIRNQDWDQIPLDTLIQNRDRITYLTPVGFQFLLPAFLLAAIEYPSQVDVLRDNIIQALIPPQSSDVAKYATFEARMEGLSSLQSQVIASFFEAYTSIYPVDKWSFTETDEIQVNRAYLFWKLKAQGTEK